MTMASSCLILSTALALSTSTASAADVFFDPDAVKHSCVDESLGTTLPPGVPVHLTDVNTTHEEQTILLPPITSNTTIPNAGERTRSMCILHRWTLPLEDELEKRGFYYPSPPSPRKNPAATTPR